MSDAQKIANKLLFITKKLYAVERVQNTAKSAQAEYSTSKKLHKMYRLLNRDTRRWVKRGVCQRLFLQLRNLLLVFGMRFSDCSAASQDMVGESLKICDVRTLVLVLIAMVPLRANVEAALDVDSACIDNDRNGENGENGLFTMPTNLVCNDNAEPAVLIDKNESSSYAHVYTKRVPEGIDKLSKPELLKRLEDEDSATCMAIICTVRRLLDDSSVVANSTKFQMLMLGLTDSFFRRVRFMTRRKVLMSLENSFLNAVQVPLVQSESEVLASIVKAADGEMGMTAMRDIYLSFCLPQNDVGMRRTLLLPRAVHTKSRTKHPATMHEAHELAMLGASNVWASSDQDDMAKSCVLLSAVAMLLCKSGSDIRKIAAFAGKVGLPFVEKTPGQNDAMHIVLCDVTWWALSNGDGRDTKVLYSGEGLLGLCRCVLLLAENKLF